MAVSEKLRSYLTKEKIQFEHLHHALAYTASKTAGAQHVPGKNFLKTVIIKYDDRPIMCVLAATHLVDFEKLKTIIGSNMLQLAPEEELTELFPEYDTGAEPPFGNLYGLDVYLDAAVQKDKDIAFNAGTHTDVIKMRLSDYIKLVNPTIAEFGKHV